jgi:membrane protein DedA with SNARE-associated domain
MLHSLFAGWMQFVHDTGYFGVFIMMAIESTVFPLPSEVVVPPAAYWASQGAFSFWGVVIASTLGSWFGSAASYLVARRLGRPLILKYGRFFFLPEKKWLLAEEWIQRYSTVGVFFARLLPVVRHLVSLPAGAARMKFVPFTLSTLLGSFVWSWVLARLLTDPDALIHVLKAKLMWLVIGVVVMLVAYIGVDLLGRRWRSEHGRG